MQMRINLAVSENHSAIIFTDIYATFFLIMIFTQLLLQAGKTGERCINLRLGHFLFVADYIIICLWLIIKFYSGWFFSHDFIIPHELLNEPPRGEPTGKSSLLFAFRNKSRRFLY